MSTTCQLFRQRWLERFAPAGETDSAVADAEKRHVKSCASCAEWSRRSKVQVGMLRTLERLVAPGALDEEVHATLVELGDSPDLRHLASSSRRSIDAVRGLTSREAPAELDVLVFHKLKEVLAESPAVRAVGSLDRVRPPAVLDRLVDENLHDATRAEAESWIGTLERKRAPRSLEGRVLAALDGGFGRRKHTWGIAAAAAVLLGFGLWWSGMGRGEEPSSVLPEFVAQHTFEVVGAESDLDLIPMARALRDSMTPMGFRDDLVEADVRVLPAALRSSQSPDRSSSRRAVNSSSSTSNSSNSTSGSSFSAPITPTGPPVSGDSNPLELLEGAPLDTVAHVGVRRIVYFDPLETASFVAYEETVSTDGLGQFTVLPSRVLSPVKPDPQTFLFLMENRQGFVHRYRDFEARDMAAFQRNYTLAPSPKTLTHLGRAVKVLSVARRDGSCSYEVWVDVETHLILSYLERDSYGKPSVWMRYQSLDLTPDLSGVFFHLSAVGETILNPGTSVASQLSGQGPHLPRLLPDGYELLERSIVLDPDSTQRWLKTTYTDGVRPLFFLERLRRTPGAKLPEGRLPLGKAGDRTVVNRLAGLTTAHARIGISEFIAVGFVDSDELLDMIQSAL